MIAIFLSLLKSIGLKALANPIKTLQVVGPALIIIFLGYHYLLLKHSNQRLTKENTHYVEVIKTKTETITKWKTQYDTLNGQLKISNARVEQLAAGTKKLESQLSTAQSKIDAQNKKLSERLTQIYSSDVPKDCPGAQKWLSRQVDISLDGWNDNAKEAPATTVNH